MGTACDGEGPPLCHTKVTLRCELCAEKDARIAELEELDKINCGVVAAGVIKHGEAQERIAELERKLELAEVRSENRRKEADKLAAETGGLHCKINSLRDERKGATQRATRAAAENALLIKKVKELEVSIELRDITIGELASEIAGLRCTKPVGSDDSMSAG